MIFFPPGAADTPEKMTAELIKLLKSERPPKALAGMIADMLDPTGNSEFRLKMGYGKTGRPHQHIDLELFKRIKNIRDRRPAITVQELADHFDVSEPTVRKYLKVIRDVETIDAEERELSRNPIR